jgi:hypothetical protein
MSSTANPVQSYFPSFFLRLLLSFVAVSATYGMGFITRRPCSVSGGRKAERTSDLPKILLAARNAATHAPLAARSGGRRLLLPDTNPSSSLIKSGTPASTPSIVAATTVIAPVFQRLLLPRRLMTASSPAGYTAHTHTHYNNEHDVTSPTSHHHCYHIIAIKPSSTLRHHQ